MDPEDPPRDDHTRAAVQHLAHGAGIHDEVLPAKVSRARSCWPSADCGTVFEAPTRLINPRVLGFVVGLVFVLALPFSPNLQAARERTLLLLFVGPIHGHPQQTT